MKANPRAPAWRARLLCAALCLIGPYLADAPSALADAPPLILEHLTTADGLPEGTVMTILQDSQGFIWLGTEDGLVRFDGNTLHRYAHSNKRRGSLPGNFIHQVVEDAHHDLWIAVKGAGLARYDRATDTFTTYRHDPHDPASLASDNVRSVLVDHSGRVWIGTADAGLDVLDPASGHMEHFRHDPAYPASLASNRVFALMQDRSGVLWIGTADGLDRWLPRRHRFAHLRQVAGDPQALSGREVSCLFEDQSGTLWIGTFDGGLDRLDRAGHVVRTFLHDPHDPTSLSSDDVRAILEDRAGHLWVGTADGLDLLQRSSGRFLHYRHDPGDADSLRDSFIMSLYEDRTGLMWIGTRTGGVSRWNPRSWRLGGQRPRWLGDGIVQAFADAADGEVWIASAGAGLVRFDPATGKAVGLDAIVGRRDALGGRRVMSLHSDRRGNLWIGTMARGLKELSPGGRLRSIPVQRGDAHSLSAAGIMTIFEARDGRIWIGTFGGGANVLDPSTRRVRQLPYGTSTPGAVSSSRVTAIAEDRHGNLWIGTDGGGLDLARADGTVVGVYRHDPKDPASLPANTVYALAIDARGRVWAGTDGGGLAQVVGSALSPAAIRFRAVGREQGLSSDTIYGVLADASGHIWLSGNSGLMRYDPDSGAVKTYHRADGLQGEEFTAGAAYRLRDGRLCFGGPGGFNIFDPSRLSSERQPPGLALTGVEILGVPARGPTPYWLRRRIDLGYRDSIVSLEFGVLDFTSPRHNRLAYRMAGLTDRWIDLGSQRRITLTNLRPGDHVLEVRAANSDSVWSRTPLRITLHQASAPWASPWAYALYALAALAALAAAVRMQRAKYQRVVRARQRLESEVRLRTRELVESNRQLAEAARAKSDFLDRMSHELRTPMNGVVGMAELLSRTPLSGAQARFTGTIRSSAQVLLQIVNDLLDLSKITAGKVQLERLPIDPARLLEECADLFSAAAQAKGVELIVCPPQAVPGALLGDPLRVRQIVMNLVGNAVKFTAQGEVVIKADVDAARSDGALVRISVRDTGIGMDAAAIGKIFEPFAQADESTTRRFGGSGLGLAICRELAGLMGGSIEVESTPQVGSTFRLSVPLQVAPAAADADSGRMPQRLPPLRARIVTRKPALAEALARYLPSLGLTVSCGQAVGMPGEPAPPGTSSVPEGARAGAGFADTDDLVIVDAGSCPDYLRRHAESGVALRPPIVVLATTAEADAAGLASLVPAACIVPKPMHGDALREAVAAAAGTPVAAAPAATGAVAEAAIGGHVLLVEDEPVNAAVAEGYLGALGCTSVWVKDGAQAVARSAAERFDLILMDLSMPGMDGFATTALIRQRDETAPAGRRVPIIALTAHGANYRDTCLRAGMDDLLTKPYTLEHCAQVLRHWIGERGGARPAVPQSQSQSQSRLPGPASGELARVDAAAVAALKKMRTGAQGDLYARLVELFRDSSSQSMRQLGEALGGDDLQAARAVCHKLRSSAANVGALAFAGEVRELGKLCAAADAAGARRSYDRLRAAHPVLLEGLTSSCLRESA